MNLGGGAAWLRRVGTAHQSLACAGGQCPPYEGEPSAAARGHKSQTFAPFKKQEISPSSLTLSTGPKRLATSAAVVRAPSAVMGEGRWDASCRRMAPNASRPP